ncbi:MAG: tetratricopeptide repeat protein [Nodosilinea sp.]
MGFFRLQLGLLLGFGVGIFLWLGWPSSAVAEPVAPARVEHFAEGTSWAGGDIQTALDYFNHQVVDHPDSAAAFGHRGLIEVELGDYGPAIADCNRAIELDRHNPDYRLTRGVALYRSGDYQAALQDDDWVLANHPQDYRGYYNRGLVNIALHDFAAAIDDFDWAVTLAIGTDPNPLADIYDDRGLAKLMAAQPEAAISDFTQALALNNEDIRALFNRGCACHQMGRWGDALADLNQVLAIAPDHARTYLKRGLLRQALGDEAGAIADLHQAADCAQAQEQSHLHHHILTVLNTWQTPSSSMG